MLGGKNMPAKNFDEKILKNKINYVKNTLEIEGHKINKSDIEFYKKINNYKYTKKIILEKVLKTHNI